MDPAIGLEGSIIDHSAKHYRACMGVSRDL